MLINAELLLQYQRCKRRPFLDVYGDKRQRDPANDLLVKLHQDKIAHQKTVLEQFTYHRPIYPFGDWLAGEAATLELMHQGVESIRHGVLLTSYSENHTLLSRPDLLVKQPGKSCFGDWVYVPLNIELGKRPKQEYQVLASFHAYVLSKIQQVELETAWLMLRGKQASYAVDLLKWTPQMQRILNECIATLNSEEAPEVFISRQKCSLCHWYGSCYKVAQSQKHLSLLPGVTPVRYTHLQSLSITTIESLANTSPSLLENLPGFDTQVAPKLVLQAQSLLFNRPLLLPNSLRQVSIVTNNTKTSICLCHEPVDNTTLTQAPIELYFDIEAQPDLNLDYLFGVLVVDRDANTENFYSFIAENPLEQELIWHQFLDLVWQYPNAPVYHFCLYEFETVVRFAKLYHTPQSAVLPVLNRFVDVYEQLTSRVALPVESYALKAIARWLGFEWRNPEASGAKCIYWYDQWLKTGNRTLLEMIQLYNEDDCRATRSVKDWLVNFFMSQQL
jgi:predicted RecB family nuclease